MGKSLINTYSNKSINTNITGTFIMTKAVIQKMLEKKSGNIINVASTYSLVAPNQDLYKLVPTFPREITLDINNRCNHKCYFCANIKIE